MSQANKSADETIPGIASRDSARSLSDATGLRPESAPGRSGSHPSIEAGRMRGDSSTRPPAAPYAVGALTLGPRAVHHPVNRASWITLIHALDDREGRHTSVRQVFALVDHYPYVGAQPSAACAGQTTPFPHELGIPTRVLLHKFRISIWYSVLRSKPIPLRQWATISVRPLAARYPLPSVRNPEP